MCRRVLVPALAFAVALVAVAPAVLAQSTVPKKQGSFGARPGGPLLTRDELRACLALQDRIRTGNADATRERDLLEKEKADIVQQGDALKEQLATLDRTSQDAVDKYNAEAAARDRRIDAFEARMLPFNQRVEALAADQDRWARTCENRRYDELDEIQIQRGK